MYKLSDEVIGCIRTILQQGMLKREDKTSEARDIQLSTEGDQVVLSESGDIRLSDRTLERVGQIINESLMTGTNIVDHMRMMRLEIVGNKLDPTVEYLKMVNDNLSRQVEEAEKIAEALESRVKSGPSKPN